MTDRANVDTNVWLPKVEPLALIGIAEPSHDDDPTADPAAGIGAGAPEERLNLLDAVKAPQAVTPPETIVHHVLETQEQGTPSFHARTIVVPGAVGVHPVTTVLEENPNRTRAIVKVLTGSGVINLTEGGSGIGGSATASLANAPMAAWPQSASDAPFKIETQAQVVAYNPGNANVLVAIWEEVMS